MDSLTSVSVAVSSANIYYVFYVNSRVAVMMHFQLKVAGANQRFIGFLLEIQIQLRQVKIGVHWGVNV